MKDFLLTTLPWIITVIACFISSALYLMYVREHECSKNVLSHWNESIRINQLACHHIRTLEGQLRQATEQDHSDDGELWKNL